MQSKSIEIDYTKQLTEYAKVLLFYCIIIYAIMAGH